MVTIANTPERFTHRGLVFSIRGRVFRRRTAIVLLTQGTFADIIRRYPEVNQVFASSFVDLSDPPEKTGYLKDSRRVVIINGRHAVEFGPRRFDRARVIARNDGREAQFLENRRLRNPQGGRPSLTGFYGVPANITSRKPGWIEKGIIAAAEPTIRLIQQLNQLEVEAEDFFQDIGRLAGRGRR